MSFFVTLGSIRERSSLLYVLVKNESPVVSELHDACFQERFFLLTPSVSFPSFSLGGFRLRIDSLESFLSTGLLDGWFELHRADIWNKEMERF